MLARPMPVLPEVGSVMTEPGFSFFYHVLGDAVLGGAAGVKKFQFGQNICFQTVFLLIIRQLEQRGSADKLSNGGMDLHKSTPLRMEWG